MVTFPVTSSLFIIAGLTLLSLVGPSSTDKDSKEAIPDSETQKPLCLFALTGNVRRLNYPIKNWVSHPMTFLSCSEKASATSLPYSGGL